MKSIFDEKSWGGQFRLGQLNNLHFSTLSIFDFSCSSASGPDWYGVQGTVLFCPGVLCIGCFAMMFFSSGCLISFVFLHYFKESVVTSLRFVFYLHLFSPDRNISLLILRGHLLILLNLRPSILWFFVLKRIYYCFWWGSWLVVCSYILWRFGTHCNYPNLWECYRLFLEIHYQLLKQDMFVYLIYSIHR